MSRPNILAWHWDWKNPDLYYNVPTVKPITDLAAKRTKILEKVLNLSDGYEFSNYL